MPLPISDAREYLTRRISAEESYDQLLSFPRYFEIETVNVCNARCPMCTIDDWQRGHKGMTDEVFKSIADELVDHSDEVKRVSLYRDGEPLIDKKLPARVAILKDGGIKNVSISTNVSLLNEERGRALLEGGIDHVILSIDSLKKEVYESIRVRLNFEEVLENALKFIELRNKIRPTTNVWVRMVRQESNFDEWPEYEKFWKPRLAQTDRLYYYDIHNWGGQLEDFRSVSESFEPNLPCVALWSLMVIFCNGDVPLCNVDYNNIHPAGNVVEQSIKEVWHSKVAQDRRELHMQGRKGEISLCEDCNVWDEAPDLLQVSSDYTELA
jgi:MoaA/NifB/PqqE/SkfB family radical SAM enzyme